MKWTNYHCHSHYCDGNGTMEEYVKQAIEGGMLSIGFSSHAPVPFDCFWTMPKSKLVQYLSEIDELQKSYKAEIPIYKSLEVDYIPNLVSPDYYKKACDLDYVIGSIHFVDAFKNGEPWAIDGSFAEFKKGLDKIFGGDIESMVKRFFSLSREMLHHNQIDIIGHLDKVKMHNVTQILFNEEADWYQNELQETLKLIKEKNVIVEINTKSYEKNGLLFPGIDLFQQLYEMDIPVMINSDSHFPHQQLLGFKDVGDFLRKIGYKYVKAFDGQKWIDNAL